MKNDLEKVQDEKRQAILEVMQLQSQVKEMELTIQRLSDESAEKKLDKNVQSSIIASKSFKQEEISTKVDESDLVGEPSD